MDPQHPALVLLERDVIVVNGNGRLPAHVRVQQLEEDPPRLLRDGAAAGGRETLSRTAMVTVGP